MQNEILPMYDGNAPRTTSGEARTWKALAQWGLPFSVIAELADRPVRTIKQVCADIQEGNRNPKTFIKQYLRRDRVREPLVLKGLWLQFVQRFGYFHHLPAPAGGDTGAWTVQYKRLLTESAFRTWLAECKTRAQFKRNLIEWVGELETTGFDRETSDNPVRQALLNTGGSIRGAARLLGISHQTLLRRIQKSPGLNRPEEIRADTGGTSPEPNARGCNNTPCHTGAEAPL